MKKNNRPRKLNRSSKGFPQRFVVVVFTKSIKIEPQYVTILRDLYRGVSIQIITRYAGSSPKVLVNRALDYKSSDKPYDEIWCLFDKNNNSKEEIQTVIDKACKDGINTAITNPCFELWLVLHQEEQNRYVSKKNIQKRAQSLKITKGKNLLGTGKKLLRGKYNDAKDRAQRLEKRHIGNGSKPWENPSSQVWKFVDQLDRLNG